MVTLQTHQDGYNGWDEITNTGEDVEHWNPHRLLEGGNLVQPLWKILGQHLLKLTPCRQ